MAGDHLLLFDASGFAFRAYYAAPPQYRPGDGEPTGAIEVFAGMVWRTLGRASVDNPTMGVAVFDAPGPTFRHKLWPLYKGGRDPARRVELDKQFPIMRAAASLLGLTAIEKEGFEADDIIATLAERASSKGIRVTIVSSDKDFAQCVWNDHVEIVDPMQRKRTREADVIRKFGVPPNLVPDVQALAGDPVDNIPGAPGCGMDTAAKLVRTFGSVEKVLANANDIRFPRVRTFLIRKGSDGKTGADWVRIYHKLATLKRSAWPKPDFEGWRLRPIFKDDLVAFMKKLGAGGRVEAIFGLDPQILRLAEPTPAAFAWWREELEHPGQTIPDAPQVGFYQRRVVKNGPFVPVRIWRDPEFDMASDEPTGKDLLRCMVGRTPKDALAEWPIVAKRPITEAVYKKMMTAWPAGKPPPPTAPADLSKIQSIPNPRRKKADV